MVNFKKKFSKFNDNVAVALTGCFGNMITAYVFAIYGLLPLLSIFSPFQDKFLYWSNWVQLWSLPVLAVGQNVIGRASERRSTKMYEIVRDSHKELMQEFDTIKELFDEQKVEHKEIDDLEKDLGGDK
jgi:hypothetical protein